ncbi:hypothetical protein MUK42_35954 [Musa troglodytarum]|uniref:Uncharacterized protein n=1 Tax=Musa troglodytarum TaxID=320322 RepID=A0A9E7JSW0_9LILI|nr:hypothetical protein MUK42_35954 [Musa troglodytarum]
MGTYQAKKGISRCCIESCQQYRYMMYHHGKTSRKPDYYESYTESLCLQSCFFVLRVQSMQFDEDLLPDWRSVCFFSS